MDGNPAAGADSIREALDRARELALGRYRSDVRKLAVALAIRGMNAAERARLRR